MKKLALIPLFLLTFFINNTTANTELIYEPLIITSCFFHEMVYDFDRGNGCRLLTADELIDFDNHGEGNGDGDLGNLFPVTTSEPPPRIHVHDDECYSSVSYIY